MTTPNADAARNVTKYLGQNYIFTPSYVRSRDPTTTDIKDPKNQGYYPYTALWINKTNNNLWSLVKIANNIATWILLSGGTGPLLQITVPNGVTPIVPDGTGNMNFTSSGGTVVITGSSASPNNHTINFDVTGGANPIEKIQVDVADGTGVQPVVPNASGLITETGGQVGAGIVGTKVIRTHTSAPNQFAIEIQRSQAVASSTVADNGVSHFSSTDFTVDGNAFVQSNGRTVKWNIISANQTLATNNGYICVSPGGALSLALPATSNLGDLIEVTLDGATSWTITQAAGQQIRVGNQQTTAGVGGSLASTRQGDTIRMVCQTANLKWNVLSVVGSLTVT